MNHFIYPAGYPDLAAKLKSIAQRHETVNTLQNLVEGIEYEEEALFSSIDCIDEPLLRKRWDSVPYTGLKAPEGESGRSGT